MPVNLSIKTAPYEARVAEPFGDPVWVGLALLRAGECLPVEVPAAPGAGADTEVKRSAFAPGSGWRKSPWIKIGAIELPIGTGLTTHDASIFGGPGNSVPS